MAMLSELLRYDLVDRSGRRAKINDFSTALLEDDYPPITGIHYQIEGKIHHLAWGRDISVNKAARFIEVGNFEHSEAAAARKDRKEVLLKADVLDALIIDLQHRRTTRASDLLLANSDGKLSLRAVDAGFGAMLRRVSRGLIRGASRRAMYDWRYVEFLRGDPHAVESGAGYLLRIGRLPAAEIAQLGDYLPYLHAAELLTLLPNEKAARALQAMSIERQVQIVDELDEDEAVDLIAQMSPDHATDLVGRLPVATMKRMLGRVPQTERERIIDLLRFPENSVGGLMINNIVSFGERTTVATALKKIRSLAGEDDFFTIVYVTKSSDDLTLTGGITFRKLLAADENLSLKDVADPYISRLDPFASGRAAAQKLISAQLAALPVTDKDGKLIGAMTIEAAIGLEVPAGIGLRGIKIFS